MSNSFTPQQIEQFLQVFFDVVGARQYIGARYVPIFGRVGEDTVEWDDGAPYEPLTVVMHLGVSYVSRQYVPTGTPITDTDFWVETYRFNAQVEQYRQEVLGFQDEIDGIRELVESDYVPFPDNTLYPKYGSLGQVLSTLEDGTTKWDDPVHVTADVAEPLIEEWLDSHPEATTTVEDGAITFPKLAESLVARIFDYKGQVTYNDYTALPTLASAQTNSLFVMTFSEAVHPVDYPTEYGYGTCHLFTFGSDNYRIQYVTSAVADGKYIMRRYHSGSWHEWLMYDPTIDDGEITRAMLSAALDNALLKWNGSADYTNYQTRLPTLASAQDNSVMSISMNDSGHQTDYPTDFGYGTLLLITVGDSVYKVQYILQSYASIKYAMRRYYSGSWHDWQQFHDESLVTYVGHATYDNYTGILPTLDSAIYNSIYYVTMSAATHQSDYPTELGYPTLLMITMGGRSNREQYVLSLDDKAGINAHRRYYNNEWHDWVYTYNTDMHYVGQVFEANYQTRLPTFADADPNSIYTVSMTSTTHQTDYPTGMGYPTLSVITYGRAGYYEQWAINATIGKKYAKRRYYSGSWHDWEYSSNPRRQIVIAPSGGDFTNIVSGLQYAYNNGYIDVLVKAGTYDVVAAEQEINGATYFQNESFNNYGPKLGNGCTYYFESGAQVNCVLPSDASSAAQNTYSPFNAGDGDYEVTGLHVYSEFCRYSFHDEMGGTRDYHHTYKDCYMHHNDTGNGYVQCIGGGLGAHGLIDIDGCVFESDTAEQSDVGIVSWHNGAASDIQSFVNIRNCYFKNGHIRFSYYGTSTKVSEMNISGCSFKGQVVTVSAETAQSTVENVSAREWCNEVRV